PAPFPAGPTASRRATDGRRGTADPAGFRAPGADISQLAVHTMSMLATAGIDGILVTRVSVRGQDGRASYASGHVGPGSPRTGRRHPGIQGEVHATRRLGAGLTAAIHRYPDARLGPGHVASRHYGVPVAWRRT